MYYIIILPFSILYYLCLLYNVRNNTNEADVIIFTVLKISLLFFQFR